MAYKVKVDRLLCIGTADCVAIAPNTFELDDEAKAVVKDQARLGSARQARLAEDGASSAEARRESRRGDSDEKILEAAKTCPVLAIIVEDEDGEQVFP